MGPNAIDVAEATAAKKQLDAFADRALVICSVMTENGREKFLTKDFIEKALELVKDKPVEEITIEDVDESYAKILRQQKQDEAKKLGFFDMCKLYLEKNNLSEGRKRNYRVLFRALERYEAYVRATDKQRRNFSLDIETINKQTVEEFFDYIANEYQLEQKNPKIFEKKILTVNVLGETRKFRPIEMRGSNLVVGRKKAFKAFYHWLQKNDYTKNDPFLGITIGSAKYGTPYYINIEERKTIASADLASLWPSYSKKKREEARAKGVPFKLLPLSTCLTQRDIFVFQCLIGCRVGDLMKMTYANIAEGVLSYIPRKTIDEKPFVVKVPLLPEALELIAKYKGKDSKGRLFPFISSQKYNDAIKEILEMCGVTRMITVRDSLTGDEKQVRICDVASSHMARRTFIGNLYKKVKDPNLVGSMSGHVEGSQAFTRYREVDMDIKQDIIKELE